MIGIYSMQDRDLRQREMVPPQKLAGCRGLVVGVGAIGRQVALQLAAVGMGRLDLVDDDTVAVENLAAQAYWPADLGMHKVRATAQLCRQIHPPIQVQEHAQRFRRSLVRVLECFKAPLTPAVFCCVDSISTRGLVWEATKGRAGFFADGRMNGEVIRVLASDRPETDRYYPTTLFAEEQAYAGSCTARSTVYTASIAAGLMLSQFTRWLRGLAVERDQMLNLLASEWTVA